MSILFALLIRFLCFISSSVYTTFFAPIIHYTPTQKRIVAPSPPPLSFKFGRTLCSKSEFSAWFYTPSPIPILNNPPRPLPIMPPQTSPPPSPPPASDSTSAGEHNPDGCHRWAFPLELPASAQCVHGRVRRQASPWNACCNRKQKKGPCPHQQSQHPL